MSAASTRGPAIPGVKRLLRLGAVALVALAAATTLNALGGERRAVRIAYGAVPAGRLVVTLRDEAGAMLRRTTFEAGAERTHEVELSGGDLRAELRVGDVTRLV